MYQKSKPATVNHTSMAAANQWFSNPDHSPFIRKIMPLSAITAKGLDFNFLFLFLRHVLPGR